MHRVRPLGTTFVSPSNPSRCTCAGGSTRLCALGNLLSGQSAQFNIIVAVDAGVAAGTQLVNSAAVSSATVDSTPGNNSDSATTTVTGVSLGADLRLTKTTPTVTVTPGTMHTFNLLIENLGPANAPGVVVTDNLPAGMAYQSDTAGPGATSACVQGPPQTLTCNLGALNSGQSRLFTINVLINANVPNGAQLTNVASVALSGSLVAANDADVPDAELVEDPNPGNNQDDVTVDAVRSADISVDKDATNVQPSPGGQVTFSVQVKNSAVVPLTGLFTSPIERPADVPVRSEVKLLNTVTTVEIVMSTRSSWPAIPVAIPARTPVTPATAERCVTSSLVVGELGSTTSK